MSDRTGTPDPRAVEDLLGHTRWMRSLARAMCTDSSRADDLVQDAWVAALERPGGRIPSRRAWIGRVLSNLSIDRRRDEVARRERERRSSRGEILPSASELVERAESQRRLVECVLSLDEPYRSTLLQRWFEEIPPEEIARRSGIPASTVRTRLSRGMAMLRERLERNEGRSWMAVLAPLAAEARPAALAGGVMMSTAVKSIVGVAALAAIVWIAWPAAEPAPEPPPIASGARDANLEAPRAEPSRAERAPVEVESAPVAPSPATTESPAGEPSEMECAGMEELVPWSTVAGIVLRGRMPLARGRVFLRRGVRVVPEDPKDPWIGVPSATPRPEPDKLWTARIGPDGRFEFHGLATDHYTLAVDAGAGTCCQMPLNLIRWQRPARTIVIVLGSAEIRGHVYDAVGKPVAGARVVASRDVVRNQEPRTFNAVAWTDKRGAYTLPDLCAGDYWIGMRQDGSATDPDADERLQVSVPLGESLRVDFGSARGLPVWTGVVRARTGEPVRGGGRLEIAGGDPRRHFQTFFDEAGSFRIRLPSGRYTARSPAPGSASDELELGSVEVREGGTTHDLVMPGVRLRGIAIDATTGLPWARREAQDISLQPLGEDYPAAFCHARIGTDGSFVFDGLRPGVWVVGAHPFSLAGGVEGRIEVTILEGETEVPLTVTIVTP